MSTNPALVELGSDSESDTSPPTITMPTKPLARPSPAFPKCISGTSGIKVRLPQLFDRKFLADATTQDPILAAVREKLEKNHRDDLKFVHPRFYSLRYDLSTVDGCLMKDHRLILPKPLRDIMLSRLHEDHLLVAVDRFSHYPTLHPCSNTDSTTIIAFLREYISTLGVPSWIFSDQGTGFVSAHVADFCSQMGITQRFSPTFDHRGTGKVERLVRTV